MSIEELADFITRGAATFFADGPEGGAVIPGKNGQVGGGEGAGADRQAAQARRDSVRRARAERERAGADDGPGGKARRRSSVGGAGQEAKEEEVEEEPPPPVWVRPHQKRRPLSEKELTRDAKAREQRHHAKERYEAMKVR